MIIARAQHPSAVTSAAVSVVPIRTVHWIVSCAPTMFAFLIRAWVRFGTIRLGYFEGAERIHR